MRSARSAASAAVASRTTMGCMLSELEADATVRGSGREVGGFYAMDESEAPHGRLTAAPRQAITPRLTARPHVDVEDAPDEIAMARTRDDPSEAGRPRPGGCAMSRLVEGAALVTGGGSGIGR